ncbi:MAG: ABC transporter permease [Clostridia bacterium]|nr:ABC transporter permease [Clostridia bacterium]
MTMRDAAALSINTLTKDRMKTLLTILGLAVGVAAILAVLTLGSAGQAQVEREIARLGVDRVWVRAEADSTRPLQMRDSEAVAAAVNAPVCAGAMTVSAVALGEMTAAAQICGYDASFPQVHAPQLTAGRMFSPEEFASGAAVVIVDETLDDALGGDTLGRRVRIGLRMARIIGVMQDMAASSGMAAMPLRTFCDTFEGVPVSELTISVPGGVQADSVGAAAEDALARTGGTYAATSLQEEIDAARAVIRIFVMVLSCVAAVCMLTGAIGVMNILLVSVRERRREIGLMKAIGGTSRQVGLLFLMEAAAYALLGGGAGLLLGWGMISLFGAWIGLDASLSAASALPVLLVSALMGVAFGVAPALRAAGMQPVDALRAE